jgi:hypothetical protein
VFTAAKMVIMSYSAMSDPTCDEVLSRAMFGKQFQCVKFSSHSNKIKCSHLTIKSVYQCNGPNLLLRLINLNGTLEFDQPNASPTMDFIINNISRSYSTAA